MLYSILQIILVVLSPLLLTIFILFCVSMYFVFRFHRKGYRLKRGHVYKKRVWWKKLFYDFPRQFVLDVYNRDPFEFKEYGLHMICGEQGSGKTTTLVYMLNEFRKQYPKMSIRTNMSYVHEDSTLSHWKQMVSNTNGVYGQIEVLDEIQTWFSSNQSKNFPVEMLTEVSQQRKQRKMIMGTAQVFSRIAKPIREQTTFVYLPMTLFGCLTIVRVSKPQFWDDEKQKFKRYIKWFFFAHTPELRGSFDTYEKIDKYIEVGFNDQMLKMKGIE